MRLTPQQKKHINKLLVFMDKQTLSMKEILEGLTLHDRKHLLSAYIAPATHQGYVQKLFPNIPNHPRQKYIVTLKGLALVAELKKE